MRLVDVMKKRIRDIRTGSLTPWGDQAALAWKSSILAFHIKYYPNVHLIDWASMIARWPACPTGTLLETPTTTRPCYVDYLHYDYQGSLLRAEVIRAAVGP